jgi:hypothetical protein
MSAEKKLLSIRMVILPLPPAFRVRSTANQFPTLDVYENSIRILGKKLPFSEIINLELTSGPLENGGIRFSTTETTYHYAVISNQSKEIPDFHLTKALFQLLIALKSGDSEKIPITLTELKTYRKIMTKGTIIMAIIIIAICALLSYLEEGCKKTHNKSSENLTEPQH